MSTTYMPNAAWDAVAESTSLRTGLFSRILAAIIEAQSRKAERLIAGHLAMLGDDRLAQLGLSPAEIATVRAGGPIREVLDRRWRPVA